MKPQTILALGASAAAIAGLVFLARRPAEAEPQPSPTPVPGPGPFLFAEGPPIIS